MNIMSIIEGIKKFLFSNMNKEFLIFLFFLLLSGVFWLITTLNETYEKEIKVPIQVVKMPKNVVITSKATDTLRVTVRDKGWVILSYLYSNQIDTLSVPFKTYDQGDGHGTVSNADLKRITDQQIEASSKVITIKPEHLTFFYNNGECKRVPVRWTGRVIPDQLYFISQVEYKPDSVDVYASKEKLETIRTIYSEPLNFVSFRDTLQVDCRLSHPSDVKVVPEQVRIVFHTDVLTEEVMENIPIRCINVPEGKTLRTFPSKVSVRYIAGVSQVKSLRPTDFVVELNYNDILNANETAKPEKCTIQLKQIPQGISRAILDIKQVDYLIEEE